MTSHRREREWIAARLREEKGVDPKTAQKMAKEAVRTRVMPSGLKPLGVLADEALTFPVSPQQQERFEQRRQVE